MRSVLSFFSMLALGLMAAAVLAMVATGVLKSPARLETADPSLDYASVIIGLGIGLAIAVISQISWAELPRRLAGWLLTHARRIHLFVWAALFVAVLLYY